MSKVSNCLPNESIHQIAIFMNQGAVAYARNYNVTNPDLKGFFYEEVNSSVLPFPVGDKDSGIANVLAVFAMLTDEFKEVMVEPGRHYFEVALPSTAERILNDKDVFLPMLRRGVYILDKRPADKKRPLSPTEMAIYKKCYKAHHEFGLKLYVRDSQKVKGTVQPGEVLNNEDAVWVQLKAAINEQFYGKKGTMPSNIDYDDDALSLL